MTFDDFAAEFEAEYWPCMERSLSVFCAIQTQWRIGMSGCTGLDYNVIPFILESHQIGREHWPEIFDDIRVMEAAALEEMRSQ